jgi:hypothetical protein
MNSNKILTEQESLSIINEMIHQTREYFQKGAANISIFWGYHIAAIALLNFILLQIPDIARYSYSVWFLTIPGIFVSIFISHKKNILVKTHINTIINHIWIAFGVSTFIFIGILYITASAVTIPALPIIITPVILTMMGIAQYATAAACKFKLYIYSAMIFWAGALICAFTYFTDRSDYQFIVMAVCMIAGLVIPGHILNSKADKDV